MEMRSRGDEVGTHEPPSDWVAWAAGASVLAAALLVFATVFG
jgi:hypothetical protein